MFGNLHPLLLMNPKEVRKATRLFELFDEHLSTPLLKLKRDLDITQVNFAYNSFTDTSEQLNKKLQEIAMCVLERETGLRIGMVVKVARDKTTVAVLKIARLHLSHTTPLSSSPNQWEWRIYGETYTSGSNNASPMMVEYSLSGNVSIERQVLNGAWLPMVSPKLTTSEETLRHIKLAQT